MDSTDSKLVVEGEYEALPQRPPRARKRQKTALPTSETRTQTSSHGVKNEERACLATCEREQNQQQPETCANREPDSTTVAPPQTAAQTDVPAGAQYEYLDHTADIQLHAWGSSLERAFESVALAMFNYMTPLASFEPVPGETASTRTFTVSGHDMDSLLFAYLDELLFTFNTEFFVCQAVQIESIDRQAYGLVARGRGATFDRRAHVAGTEIKAITYSAMSVTERTERADVYVIVDI